MVRAGNTESSYFKRLLKSAWFFPLFLLVPLLMLSALRISGSSAGSYNQTVYGPTAKDPNLLFGHPRPVRSDEWLVGTQLALAQKAANYPKVNHNLGTGINMAVQSDAPYKDWSSIFKPQNLSFFVLPFDNAFALKWWLLVYSVIVSSYFFILRFLKDRRLPAALLATAFGLSPFLFWWYLPSTFLSLAYAILIIILCVRIIDGESVSFLKSKRYRWSALVYFLVLTYLLAAFGLLLYPPFQIPVAIVTALFLLGYLLNRLAGNRKQVFTRLSIVIPSLLLTIAIGGIFYAQNKNAIRSIDSTVYPGVRVATSGGTDPLNLFDSFMLPQLESTVRGTHFFANQSEASNFILLAPFLTLPAIAMSAIEYKKKRQIDWLFVAIQLVVLLFLARMFIHFGDGFYNLIHLDRVPNTRLIIGLGFAGFIQIVLLLKKLSDLKLTAKKLALPTLLYCLICFAVLVFVGHKVIAQYLLFIGLPKMVLLAAGFSLIIFLILTRRLVLAGTWLLIFSLGCVVYIHPLYRGLGWIENNQVYKSIDAVSKPGDRWAVADLITMENLPALAGRDSISGVKLYPDLNFWDKAQGPNSRDIYNRYAHVVFVSSPDFSQQLYLVQPDFFEVNLNCSPFITHNVDYVLDTSLLSKPCLQLKDKVSYPAATFYMYKVVKS